MTAATTNGRRPRGNAGWRQLEQQHRARIERLAQTLKDGAHGSRYTGYYRRPQYLHDVEWAEASAENDTRDMDDAHKRAVRWEQALAWLIGRAYRYYRTGDYCGVGWNVFNRAIGTRMISRRRWNVSIGLLGEMELDATQREVFERNLRVFVEMNLPGWAVVANTGKLQQAHVNGQEMVYPLRSGEVEVDAP